MAGRDKEIPNAVEPGQQPFANLLNENQRRALTTVLRRVELAVWRLEEHLTRGESHSLALTHPTNPLSSAQQVALLVLTNQIRQEIAKLALDYQLEAAEENFSRSIMAEFSLLWADLEDTRPQRLRRYGEIHPQAIEVLEPPLQRLIDLVLAIDGVAEGKQESTPTENL